MCAMGAIVQQKEQNIRNLDSCERWLLFISLGCKIVWQSASTLHATLMENLYCQLLIKMYVPQMFYHRGHVFHAIQNVQSWIFNFSKIKLFVCLENDCQSRKKCTMNSLASPVTKGHGRVPPAGLFLISGIWNRLQKTRSNTLWSSSIYTLHQKNTTFHGAFLSRLSVVCIT